MDIFEFTMMFDVIVWKWRHIKLVSSALAHNLCAIHQNRGVVAMSLFGKILNSVKKFENKKLMRAIVGGCLLVAAADGTIDPSEIEKMQKLLSANEALSGFKPSEIMDTIQHFTDLLDTDFDFGKKKIFDEIAEITDEKSQCEDVFVCMIAIAKANGKIENEERTVLLAVASLLGLKPSNFNI